MTRPGNTLRAIRVAAELAACGIEELGTIVELLPDDQAGRLFGFLFARVAAKLGLERTIESAREMWRQAGRS